MALVSEAVKAAVKYGGKGVGIPYVGEVFLAYGLIKAAVSDSDDEQLSVVQKMTGCTCWGVLAMDWSPPTIRCLEAVAKKRHGCAFVVGGTALYHPQTDIDVRVFTPKALRWNEATKKVDFGERTHVKRCRNCSGA